MKMSIFCSTNALFRCFCARIWENYCYIRNQHPQFSLIGRFCEIINMSKFGKIVWAKILKNYFHIWNQHLQICQIVKFFGKMIMSKFVTKNALFRYLCGGIWQQFCHIWNQQHQICLTGRFCELIRMPKFENGIA